MNAWHCLSDIVHILRAFDKMENETWSPLFDHADLIHCENFTNYFNCQTAFIEEHGYDKYIQCLNSLVSFNSIINFGSPFYVNEFPTDSDKK